MAYCTQDDIAARLDGETLLQLSDDDNDGQPDSVVVNAAIQGASGLMDSLLSPAYPVPLQPVPASVREHCAVIAVYRLHLFRSVDPGPWKESYRDSVNFLQQAAEGKTSLEGVDRKTVSAAASESRRFSRRKLSEW